MLNSVFLFTGDNVYTLRQELQRWRFSFIEKYGENSLFVFNSENWDNRSLNQALFAWWLFVSKKMVIIEWVPKDMFQDWWIAQDKIDKFFSDFEANQQYLTDDTMVLFVSFKPDKRTRIYKWLSENVQVKNFDLYKEVQLKSFVKEQLQPLTISQEVLDYFLEKVWTDMFRLSSEIEKIKYVVTSWEVTQEMVDTYCFWMVEANVFAIIDQLFTSPIAAVHILENMQREWRDWNAILGPLLWSLKVVLTVVDYADMWIKDSKQIASETKLPPFTIAKNMKNIDLYLSHSDKLKNLFKEIINTEYWIKTGKYPDSYFWLSLKNLFFWLSF